MFAKAFAHISAPVDEYHAFALKNLLLCGVLSFVFVVVGVGRLVAFAIYLLAVAVTCLMSWLCVLPPRMRGQVLENFWDVVRAFCRNCADQAFGDGVGKKRAGRGGESDPVVPGPADGGTAARPDSTDARDRDEIDKDLYAKYSKLFNQPTE